MVLGRLNGWKAGDALAALERALIGSRSPAREPELRALEPKNGWGTLDNVRKCLAELVVVCRENPDAVIWASG